MKLRYLMAVLCTWPMVAQAAIYKSVDANGHVTYSSAPIKGGKKLDLPPLSTMAPPAKTASPEGFPKVSEETQKSRDGARRKILEDELASEEKLLEEARQNLKEGEEKPEVFKTVIGYTKEGKPIMGTRRDVSKYQEKIKTLTEQVELHQKNIEALKTELSKFK